MEFSALPRTIKDTFNLQRKYVIPRFQREYSWENNELEELWIDLIDSIKIENKNLFSTDYFIGSLVLVGEDDDSQNMERQVVDGQQRLMTITIAFAVLSQIFKKLGEEKLSEIAHNYIIGEDENGNFFTKVVSETPKPFFQYRIQQKIIDFDQKPNSTEEKRILAAYNFFEQKLEESNLQSILMQKFNSLKFNYLDSLKAFRDQVLTCKVICVTVKSFDDAYTIFEVLNAKGKDLSPVDIIKNSIFSILDQTEPIDSAHDKWTKIRNKMTEGKIDDITTFYRHYWLSKYGMVTNRKLVKEFNLKIEKNIQMYEKFLNELEDAANDYAKITIPNFQDWNQPENRKVYETLDALNIFGVTQVRIFLLALFDCKNQGLIKHQKFIEVLEFLQYFHFVFNAICSERSSGLERRYSSYAQRLRNSASKKDSADCINDLITAQKKSIPSFPIFLENFKKLSYTDSYQRDKRLIQYILKRVEFYFTNSSEKQIYSFSIEHITSQSAGNDFIGLIGNLLPIGVDQNCAIGDKPFMKKLEYYKESQYKTTSKFYEKYKDEKSWDEKKANERTEEIAKVMYNQKIQSIL